MHRWKAIFILTALLLARSGLQARQEFSGKEVAQVLDRADGLLEVAKATYETARVKNSVEAYVDAAFKLEEARIKYMVVQEIGQGDTQKTAADRLRAVNQLSKLIHDGRTAISGKAVDSPKEPAAPSPAPESPKPAPAVAAAPGVSARLPVPNVVKQKDAEKSIRDLYKEQYGKKGAGDKSALARELLVQAGSATEEPARRWTLFREAQDLAAQAPDIQTAIQAADGLCSVFDVEPFSIKFALLTTVSRSLKTPEEFISLTNQLLALGDQLMAVDDYAQAEKVLTAAAQGARRSNDAALQARAAFRVKEIAEARAKYEGMKKFLETLAKHPDDAGANAEMGLFMCLFKGNWDLGLRFLVKGSEPGLKAAAEKDLLLPVQPVEQISAGDTWWDLGDREKNAVRKEKFQDRARYWYQAALPAAPPLLKSRIEKRLDRNAADPGAPIDLLRLIDPKTDSVLGEWSMAGKSLVCTAKINWSRILIPYAVPEEYDLTILAERNEGNNALIIGLGRPTSQVAVVIDGWGGAGSGLSMLDGKWGNENETYRRGGLLKNGRPSAITCSVRKEGVAVVVDGKRIIDWRGGTTRLSNPAELGTSNSGAIYLGCQDSKCTVAKITLTTVSGEGRKLR